MSKPKAVDASPWQSFLSELFQVQVYKRTQGRVARQATFTALLVFVSLAAWRLYVTLRTTMENPTLAGLIPLAFLVAGLWFSYRLVNISRFAEFLINVEAEMAKVSWPSWNELVRSSLVVIVVMFFLAMLLFMFDFVWRTLFLWLGVGG